MTEYSPAPSAPQPIASVPQVVCANCGRPAGPVYYRVAGRIACPDCARLIAALMGKNTFAFGPWLMGALAGLGTAIAFAVIWALIAKGTGFRGGLIAVFIGVFVSAAVVKGSGGRRGPAMQVLAIALSLFGIWLGKGLCASWSFYDLFQPSIEKLNWPPAVAHIYLLAFGFYQMFNPFDLIWYGFAVYDGWRRPRAIRIPIEGPFSQQAQAARGPLQFDAAEFIAPPTSAPPPTEPPQ